MSCRLNGQYLHFNSVSDEPCTEKLCWLIISLAICQSLRSHGSDTLLRVFPFLQTPIFCALFFPPFPSPSFCFHSFLLSRGAFFVVHTSLPSIITPSHPSLLYWFYCVCAYVCSSTDSTCTGMLTDLKRDQINHCFLQTEQFKKKNPQKTPLSIIIGWRTFDLGLLSLLWA